MSVDMQISFLGKVGVLFLPQWDPGSLKKWSVGYIQKVENHCPVLHSEGSLEEGLQIMLVVQDYS